MPKRSASKTSADNRVKSGPAPKKVKKQGQGGRGSKSKPLPVAVTKSMFDQLRKEMDVLRSRNEWLTKENDTIVRRFSEMQRREEDRRINSSPERPSRFNFNTKCCPVCRVQIRRCEKVSALNPCGHVLCGPCISNLRKAEMPCPCCRKTVEEPLVLYFS